MIFSIFFSLVFQLNFNVVDVKSEFISSKKKKKELLFFYKIMHFCTKAIKQPHFVLINHF